MGGVAGEGRMDGHSFGRENRCGAAAGQGSFRTLSGWRGLTRRLKYPVQRVVQTAVQTGVCTQRTAVAECVNRL
jgi:hypothetical protein